MMGPRASDSLSDRRIRCRRRAAHIARDREGGPPLCRTSCAAQLAGEKTKPKATFALVAENAAGLYALTGCAHGAVQKAVRAGDLEGAREHLARFQQVFGE